MNPFRRLLDFITNPSNSRTVGVLVVLIIALAIPLTVNIAQQQQELRQRADTCTTTNLGVFCSDISSPGVTCSQAGSSPGCPAGTISYSCTQQTCTTPTAPPASTAPTSSPVIQPTTGVCPQITAGGSQGAGGNCDSGAPNKNIGTCTSNKCATAPNGVPGHTISVCQFNPQAGRLCYANNPNECWPDAACPAAATCSATPPGNWDSLCTLPTSPIIGTAPCENHTKDPFCTQAGALAVKRQSDASWYCFNTSTTKFIDFATCGASTSCKTDAASAVGCNVGCTVVNGVNMKCHTQNKDANGVCSASCTTGGPWNCVLDSTCPVTTGGTQIVFSNFVGLDGLGSTGDQKNPNPSSTGPQSQGSNKNPVNKSRDFTVELFDAAGASKSQGNGKINYDSSTGKFNGTANLQNVTTGTYTLKIKSPGYLRRTVSTAQTITANQTNTITAAVSLVTGDIDRDGKLTVLDYNFFSPGNCLFKPATGTCASADLDDNGEVNQFDYNLFIREISSVQNGD